MAARPPQNKICTECGKGYIGFSNSRKYCDTCKEVKYKEMQKRAWTKNNQRAQAKEHSTYRKGKSRCLVCGAWVKAPAMHAYQKHGISAHDYKDAFNLPYGKGLLSPELKEIKREHVFANGTVKNLLRPKSVRSRFKKGEQRVYDGVLRKAELGLTKQPNV